MPVGHSTRSIDEFVGLLRSVGVRLLVDVRTVPRSRRNPQFNREVLPATLADFQIGSFFFPLTSLGRFLVLLIDLFSFGSF
jgi:uncharacterized protein (DUF488 family)